MNSGASAMVTALIVILGMTFAGFGVGYVLGLDMIKPHISWRHDIDVVDHNNHEGSLRPGTPGRENSRHFVLAVLIIEDLFAVLMLVLLSSIAMGDVKGSELLFSIGKLFFPHNLVCGGVCTCFQRLSRKTARTAQRRDNSGGVYGPLLHDGCV